MEDKDYLSILKSQPMKRIKKQSEPIILMENIELLEAKILSEDNGTDIKDEITKFFLANPNPDDSKVHELADNLGIDPHELESNIYALLSSLLKVGKHRDVPAEKFDANQIKMGIDIEKEHTDDPTIAIEIAKDHLDEIPDYYTRLKDMEDSAKKKG